MGYEVQEVVFADVDEETGADCGYGAGHEVVASCGGDCCDTGGSKEGKAHDMLSLAYACV